MPSTHPFGIGGKGSRTVHTYVDSFALNEGAGEFLAFEIATLGPRPVMNFMTRGYGPPLFTQDDMTHTNGVYTYDWPTPGTPIQHGDEYGLLLSFAGATGYQVTISRCVSPPASGAVQVLQLIRRTSLKSDDIRDWFPESFFIA